MPAPFAFDTDPFAAPFTEAAPSPAEPGRASGAASPTWPVDTTVRDTTVRDTTVRDTTMRDTTTDMTTCDMAPVAESLWAAGFGRAALEAARLAGDARVDEWAGIATADAALAAVIASHGVVAIPSVQLRADGAPRFVVCGDEAHALRTQFADEHGERGVDAELRLFLDEALQPGDRYVDARPGAGFASLTAATRDGVSVVALVDDARTGDALRRSARASGCDAAVTVRDLADARALALGAHAGATVLHAGHAANVAILLQAMRAATGTVPVDAVAWRCGAAHDADFDAEAMQVAAAVLGVLGFRHFALAVGEQGVELVPAEAMASNEMIFSLGEAFLARAGG